MVLNVLELFAENEQQRIDARAGWIARGETLELMYDNIEGLNEAQLETKNFVYYELLRRVYPLVRGMM